MSTRGRVEKLRNYSLSLSLSEISLIPKSFTVLQFLRFKYFSSHHLRFSYTNISRERVNLTTRYSHILTVSTRKPQFNERSREFATLLIYYCVATIKATLRIGKIYMNAGIYHQHIP